MPLHNDEKSWTAAHAAQVAWTSKHTTRIVMNLNHNTDADIIEQLSNVPSKQGYIKSLIRADMVHK